MTNPERDQNVTRRYFINQAIGLGTGIATFAGAFGVIAAIADTQRRSEEYGYAKRDIEQAFPKSEQVVELARRFPNKSSLDIGETLGAVAGGMIAGIGLVASVTPRRQVEWNPIPKRQK